MSAHTALCASPRFSDESALGYMYRSLRENDLALPWLRNRLGIRNDAFPQRMHHQAVVEVFGNGIGPDDLYEQTRGKAGGRMYGLNLTFRSQVRFRHPAICPLCVYTNQYLRKSWDLTASTVCSKHACYLVDSCSWCDRKISWARPWICTCTCGCPLGIEGDLARLASSDLMLAHWIDIKLQDGQASSIDVFRWLDLLEYGQAIYLLLAFGINERPYQSHRPSWASIRYSIPRFHEILNRGFLRFTDVMSSDERRYSKLDPFVHEPALAKLAWSIDSPLRHTFIDQIYARIFKYHCPSSLCSNSAQLSFKF